MNRRLSIRVLSACALTMELAFASIHLARNPQQQVQLLMLAYAISGVAFVWLLRQLRFENDLHPSKKVWAVVIGAAVVFRMTLLPLEPASSPDVNRYLWEGLVQTHGFNPYLVAPDSTQLATLAQERPVLHAGVYHAHWSAIYPPFAQLLFWGNAVLFGGTLIGWKIILLAFDAIFAGAAYWILRHRALPAVRVAAVLWCPILLLETYEGAHLDMIGMSLLAGAIAAMERQRWAVSALALALSIQIKYLWPALAMVLLLPYAVKQRRALAFLTIVAATTAACWLPYRDGILPAFVTAARFVEDWSFNDPFFQLQRMIFGHNWVPMMAVFGLLLVFATLLTRHGPGDLWQDAWLLSATALLLGPVAYPWYFLWIVPGFLLRPPSWLIAWPFTVAIFHLLIGWRNLTTGHWDPLPWLWPAIAILPLVGLIGRWRRRLGLAFSSTPSAIGFAWPVDVRTQRIQGDR